MSDEDEVLGNATGYINTNDLMMMEEKFKTLSRKVVHHTLKIEEATREAAGLMVAMADAHRLAREAKDDQLADAILSMKNPSDLLEEDTDEQDPVQDI